MISGARTAFIERTRLALRSSPIAGVGCFALAAIDIGTWIAEYRGELIDLGEAWRRDNPESSDYSPYVVHLEGEAFIDGAIGGDDVRYLNHSCDPNCRLARTEGRVFIVATRRISESEELTIDYAFDQGPGFACNCGSFDCRGAPHRSELTHP